MTSMADLSERLSLEDRAALQAALMFGRLSMLGTDVDALLAACPEIEDVRRSWLDSTQTPMARLEIRTKLAGLLGEGRMSRDFDAIAPKDKRPKGRDYALWSVEQWDKIHGPGGSDERLNVMYGRGAAIAAAAYCFAK